MAELSESVRELFHKRVFVHLATVMQDGSPQASPVWADVDGNTILINSAEGRLKDRNLRRDRRVALSVTDPENPYSAVMIRGTVEDITTEGADSHIDKMAKKYMDKDRYPYRSEGEVRVLYRIRPDTVRTMP